MKDSVSHDMHHEFMTAQQVSAEFPHISYQAILRWARKGEVPVTTLPNGRKLFRRSDIVALFEPEPVKGDDPPFVDEPFPELAGVAPIVGRALALADQDRPHVPSSDVSGCEGGVVGLAPTTEGTFPLLPLSAVDAAADPFLRGRGGVTAVPGRGWPACPERLPPIWPDGAVKHEHPICEAGVANALQDAGGEALAPASCC